MKLDLKKLDLKGMVIALLEGVGRIGLVCMISIVYFGAIVFLFDFNPPFPTIFNIPPFLGVIWTLAPIWRWMLR